MDENSMHEVVMKLPIKNFCGKKIMPGAKFEIFMHDTFMPPIFHARNLLYAIGTFQF